ncbi:zinc knuckle [Metarhizium robertsii ARSEF 23]|uniref:Zinc knuckle n=1 Tax=Metarhizium robertsii (strain ARSEF 23 / ATCC MYA-3075) TaxID=655844 RepID=E9FE22_METRA|nr:zinc knuckle [Metarhizium robertsii ARSEF 23]EFY94018.2 zinc knuckle [Metarhizium robertsii ARSEF 23]
MARWARNRDTPSPEVTPALQHPDTPQTQRRRQIFSEKRAQGPDGIPNKALQLVATWIKPHLTALFNQSLNLGYCPQHFRESTTVVLRKQGKDNYTVPGSYRPIGLLNTIGKVMDAIIANHLSYVAETYSLLPSTYIGGRKLRSPEHAIHHIIDKIYEEWNRGQGQVASLLLLDVSGAFDNISHKRLLHNLRKRRIDDERQFDVVSSKTDTLGSQSTGTKPSDTKSPQAQPYREVQSSRRHNRNWLHRRGGYPREGSFDATPNSRAMGENSCISLLTKQVPAHTFYKGTHESRHTTSTANSLVRDPGKANLQIYRTYHGLCAAMETSRRRGTAEARAATAISGAFKATSAAALDIEAHLLPMEHQTWKRNTECLGRIGFRGQDSREHESQHGANNVRERKTKMSPRKAIQKAIQDEQEFNITGMEAMTAHVVPPWWIGPKAFVEENAEKAQERHRYSIDNEPNAIHLYTDRSGNNGHVGAAAVCTTINQTKSAYMGDDNVSTAYAGELQGISLALQIAQEDRNRGSIREKVLIYTDNQAAVRSVARPRGESGSYLLQDITRRMQELQAQGLTVEDRWIPAHTGIHGNEAADQAAKNATGWRKKGPPGPKAQRSQRVNKRWQAQWQQETRGRATFRHTSEPTPKVSQPRKHFSKRQSAIYVQLQNEKIGLNNFLFKRRVPGVTDPRCDCGESRQTVAHILLQCRRYATLRKQELGQFPERHNLRAILSECKVAAKVVNFMEQTQILGQFRINP